MTRAIVELGAALGMVTIAEGVTSEAQRRFLVEHGCPLAQGFHFARPLIADGRDGAAEARRRGRRGDARRRSLSASRAGPLRWHPLPS